MNLETLTVKLTADLSGLKTGMAQANTQISGLSEKVKTSTANISKSFKNVGKGVFDELKKVFKQLTTAIALAAFANQIKNVVTATDGWKEKVLGVKDKWNELIQNTAELLMPLIEKIIPVLEKVVTYLNSVANKIASYFGIKLTSNLKKTLTLAEKVKATISSFDDLNVLNNSSDSTSFLSEDITALENITDTFENSEFSKKFSEAFNDLHESLSKIDWTTVKELGAELGKLALNGLIGAIELVSGAIDGLIPLLNPLISVLKTVTEAINKYLAKEETTLATNVTEFNNKYNEAKEYLATNGNTNSAENNETIAKALTILQSAGFSELSISDSQFVRQAAQGYIKNDEQQKRLDDIFDLLKSDLPKLSGKQVDVKITERLISTANNNYITRTGTMLGVH